MFTWAMKMKSGFGSSVCTRPGHLRHSARCWGCGLSSRARRKSSLRSKVEFPFRIIKRLWGHASVRYRGLAKNTARLHLLFALSNLYQSRRALLAA